MADDQKCISSDAKSCSIVIELSKSDPHFDKKKELLESKGFFPIEHFYLSCVPSPDWIETTLKKMLEMLRIIHLDETELYFGEVVVEALDLEFYSPRNELVALNSAASLLDKELSSGSVKQTNVKYLHDAVIDMIHEFGDKNKLHTKILEDCSCDREMSLLQWGESNGMKTKLKISYVEGAGRGAIAKEDLKVGDVALEIPSSIIISEELVHESDMYSVLKGIDGISSETMLLLWGMKEKHNHDSKFKNYFDTLPTEFNTGLSFGMEALLAMDNTLLFEEIMQGKEHLRSQYDNLFPVLCNRYPDVFPPELYTWEEFLWACELWYSNSMKVSFGDGQLRTCLIPIAGFLNHSLYPHIVHYGKVDSATNTLKFPLSRKCSAGEQCFLSYGNYSSYHLITFYGFLPQGDNLYDVIPLEFNCNEAEYTEGCSSHMVRQTWLSRNHGIFYYGLPSPLLDYLRSQSSMIHTKTLDRHNLEVEREVLQNLLDTFDDMMERLGDSNINDRKNLNWDVQLAMEFKDIQRSIISSVITSCFTGIGMVKDELEKITGGTGSS